jgi:hypothetical protein
MFVMPCLSRTLSKPNTCLTQIDVIVLSTKCLCNLNLFKLNTCLNRTNSLVPKGFGLDRFHCSSCCWSLLNGDSSTYSSYEILDKDTIPCPLDFPFTCSEIKKGIRKLKNGKKEGSDLILNEFIKTGSQTM